MDVEPTAWDSYFQIAGIHGAPYSAWDGAGNGPDPAQIFKGYCTHGSVLFPTWHRPYVALIEQAIQKHALEIAEKYATYQPLWKAAAISLRQPYWDWAASATPPDEIYISDTLTIPGPPNGQPLTVNNPFKWTYRCAQIDSNKIVSDNLKQLRDNIDGKLSSAYNNRRKQALSLLQYVKSWARFSRDDSSKGSGPSQASLEAVHALIHTGFGGISPFFGHMGSPQTAAFDPIFWLHHSQTDRLLSLWLALNSDPNNSELWIPQSKDIDGTWTTPAGGVVDESTDLTPFYNTSQDGHFWKSSDLRVPPNGLFGYSYPEFDGLDFSDRSAVAVAIKNRLNTLYGITVAVQQWHQFHTTGVVTSTSGAWDRADTQTSGPDATAPVVLHWSAHVTAKKFELGGSFCVLLFLGPAPDLPEDWRSSPSYVGEYAAFVNSEPARCANCLKLGMGALVGSNVSLNDAIIERAAVRSLDPSEVVPYLRRELCWRVEGGPTGHVHPGDFDGLEVDVSATPVYLIEKEDDFYPIGELQMYHEVTRGRPGGCLHPHDL
ncbi:common central domain of tyrosinase-domain-containing protein [Trametes gibbosa]|nr:common central domain of tyrosinase-domain-containing protein [Trametes gibbosa]